LTLDKSQNATFGGTVSDSKGDVRLIPVNVQSSSSAYILTNSDSGKVIYASGDITVPQFLTAGMAVTIINNTAGDITLSKIIGTMYWTADGSSASRTLASRGMATLWWYDWNTVYVSGAGLS